jgi:hypothetical protein
MAHWMFFTIKTKSAGEAGSHWTWIRQDGVHTLKTSRVQFPDLDSCLADARSAGMSPSDTHEVDGIKP